MTGNPQHDGLKDIFL